jgi:hypothetical protein
MRSIVVGAIPQSVKQWWRDCFKRGQMGRQRAENLLIPTETSVQLAVDTVGGVCGMSWALSL